jgi:hypothetical protein
VVPVAIVLLGAGELPKRHEHEKWTTADRFELHLGNNHLGRRVHGLLLDLLPASAGSRVVVVGHAGHRMGGPIDLSDFGWRTW